MTAYKFMAYPASTVWWVSLKTLTCKEVTRFMRIWMQTLLPSAMTMTLYFLIFGKFIGSQLHQIGNHSYIQYIVPGLVMMSIMNNAYTNTSSSFFIAKFNRSLEEMLVSPMPNLTILLGYMIGGVLRGLFVGAIVGLVARLFTHIPLMHPGVTCSMALLAAAVFSLSGLINGILAKRFDDISFVPTFILTPLTYLGGVFYSIQQLPPLWQSFSLLNPIFAIVDTFRYGFLGVTDLSIIFGFFLITLLLIIVFSTAWWLLSRGIRIKT